MAMLSKPLLYASNCAKADVVGMSDFAIRDALINGCQDAAAFRWGYLECVRTRHSADVCGC